jgi:hypothetical protein
MRQPGEHPDRERPVEEAQGVQETHEVQREHRARQHEGQHIVLPGHACLFVAVRTEELRFLEDEGGELVDCAERTGPATDDPAQDDRHEDRDPGEREGREERPGRDERRQRDERVEVEEPLHRPADVVLSRVSARSEKKDEEAEEPGLGDDAQDLKRPVLLRSFVFQRAVSPIGMSRGRAPGPASGTAVPPA